MSEDKQVHHIIVCGETSYSGPKVPVDVNSCKPLHLPTDNFDVYVTVRIRDYANDEVDHEDHSNALKYFEDKTHVKDSFSIQFVITFKKDVEGDTLVWGNDWDNPIKQILPWGFSAAFAAFKYAIDPSVEGDVYADKPWIYGNLLSSINYMEKVEDGTDPKTVKGPIREEDASTRYKKYLDKDELGKFTFKKGETWAFDFANPYLEMSTTPKIKMPGFTFDVGQYADLTELRYVLKCGDDLVFALTFEAQKKT